MFHPSPTLLLLLFTSEMSLKYGLKANFISSVFQTRITCYSAQISLHLSHLGMVWSSATVYYICLFFSNLITNAKFSLPLVILYFIHCNIARAMLLYYISLGMAHSKGIIDWFVSVSFFPYGDFQHHFNTFMHLLCTIILSLSYTVPSGYVF